MIKLTAPYVFRDKWSRLQISRFSQMSVIFRFVSNGKVLERFLGFFNVSEGRTANDIFTLLQQILVILILKQN
jgi:hypothetical protein